jgi:[acyl-carrier-protein] S-malonyltransferase
MKKAYVFPGQGAQFPGMGKELYDKYENAKELFEKANEILGFRISDIMFNGTEEELKQTKVTQPAIFLHSVILAELMGEDFKPDMVAGHSLGEFSALVAAKAMSFEDGLKLVSKRAMAMQKACELQESTMAAIIGLDEHSIIDICQNITKDGETVVPANFNNPQQIVISGTKKGIERAVGMMQSMGARRAVVLNVSGAFHSPLMEPARVELQEAINETNITEPICPIYQNATAEPATHPMDIKMNLISQLTSPVMWTQSVERMIEDGAEEFIEVGPGNVLQGLVKKINRKVKTSGIQTL